MFGGLFDINELIKNMLPPGVTVENLTAQAGQIAQQMIKTAHTVERVEQLLIALNAKVDAYQAHPSQGATVTPIQKESNNDNGNLLPGPGNPASADPDNGHAVNPASVNSDSDRRSAGSRCDCAIGSCLGGFNCRIDPRNQG